MGLSGEEKVLVRQGVGALPGCWGRALSARGGAAVFCGCAAGDFELCFAFFFFFLLAFFLLILFKKCQDKELSSLAACKI